jgi:DNA polymerase-3 subunit gamma/tau
MSDSPARQTSHDDGGPPPAGPYRVLARSHRPQRLSELIGQEALVRTLTNALRTGRIAQAFLLTGIRGVGKTSTARIIARALNCVGADGEGGPTPEPCGVCPPCVAIAEGRHIDVIEMDAATHTGIDDVRELVDSVRYAPTSARYKAYIVDEVHMLSQQAFNGLLKTLEEPPPRTIFVFATTEVRKVPATILSRCQRFDLRRVEGDLLQRHLAAIAEREQVAIAPAALALIVRAAEGSVRDGLSLLDQAIALSGGAEIDARQIQDMLGLADRGRVLALFEHLMGGEVRAALDQLGELHDLGVEPEAVVRDLLEISHWLSRIRIVVEAASAFGIDDAMAARGRDLAGRLGMAVLARTWQMLLKGLDDLRNAPSPLLAAEMLLIRIAYAADLPPPADLRGRAPVSGGATVPAAAAIAAPSAGGPSPAGASGAGGGARADPTSCAMPGPTVTMPPSALAAPASFAETVELFRARGAPMLHGWLYQAARLVRFEPGRLELILAPGTPADLPGRVAESLREWTGRPWLVSLASAEGEAEPTLAEQAMAQKRARLEELAEDPRVAGILARFEGARVVDVGPLGTAQDDALDQTAERS